MQTHCGANPLTLDKRCMSPQKTPKTILVIIYSNILLICCAGIKWVNLCEGKHQIRNCFFFFFNLRDVIKIRRGWGGEQWMSDDSSRRLNLCLCARSNQYPVSCMIFSLRHCFTLRMGFTPNHVRLWGSLKRRLYNLRISYCNLIAWLNKAQKNEIKHCERISKTHRYTDHCIKNEQFKAKQRGSN